MTSGPDRHDPLDEWLASARWPEPPPGALARVERGLRNERAREALKHGMNPPVGLAWMARFAAAASVLIIASGLVWFARSLKTRKPVGVPDRIAMPVARRLDPLRVAGRQPTPLEVAVVQALARRDERARPAAPPKLAPSYTRKSDTAAPPPRVAVASAGREAIALRRRLVAADAPDAQAALIEELAAGQSPPVDALITLLGDPLVSVRTLAARALGRIDGPALTRRLARLAERGPHRQEALLALASSDGVEARRFVRRVAATGPLMSAARSAIVQTTRQTQ